MLPFDACWKPVSLYNHAVLTMWHKRKANLKTNTYLKHKFKREHITKKSGITNTHRHVLQHTHTYKHTCMYISQRYQKKHNLWQGHVHFWWWYLFCIVFQRDDLDLFEPFGFIAEFVIFVIYHHHHFALNAAWASHT